MTRSAPALILGPQPSTAVADNVAFQPAGCLRCDDHRRVIFRISDVQTVTAELPGTGRVSAVVGTALVYDARQPARVTTAQAWAGGRAQMWAPFVWLTLAGLLLLALVSRARHRRALYRQLRPDIPVSGVHADKNWRSLTVRFTDGKAITYNLTEPFRTVLAEKILRDGKRGVAVPAEPTPQPKR